MLKPLNWIFLLIITLPLSQALAICSKWSPSHLLGFLDHGEIFETGALAISSDGRRMFHMNDGDESTLYITDLSAKTLKKVRLSGWDPRDVEDMAFARWQNKNFLIIADIGDNKRKRKTLQLGVVAEDDVKSGRRAKVRTVTLKYPEEKYDSESIAFDPSGDLYILTKNRGRKRKRNSKLYRLRKELWLNTSPSQSNTHDLELVGDLDLSSMAENKLETRATSMDISKDGRKLAILTYGNIVEFDWSQRPKESLIHLNYLDHRRIQFQRLAQQEALTYTADASSLIVSSEYAADSKRSRGAAYPERAPLIQLSCVSDSKN